MGTIVIEMSEKLFVILMAEDSEHDIRAIKRIWDKNSISNPLKIVKDGAECIDYLLRQGQYSDPTTSPPAGVLILDLNLPKMDGFEVLRRIKETPVLKRLPVIVLTTSSRQEDLMRSYDLGANAFIMKPMGMEKLNKALVALNLFWEIAELPHATVDDYS